MILIKPIGLLVLVIFAFGIGLPKEIKPISCPNCHDEKCKDNGIQGKTCSSLGSGYTCVSRSDISNERFEGCQNRKNTAIGIDQWWIHEDLYCDGSDEGNPCNCCKPRPCPDMGCSRLGKEYSCFAPKDVNLKIMECSCENKLCNSKSSLLGKPCKCCKYVKEPPCTWKGWQDNDNPSGHGDWEMKQDSCSVIKYEVQLVTGGPIYNNVNQITGQILFENSDKNIFCQNIVQPPSVSGVPCKDYRVRYCCADSNLKG